MTTPKWNAKHPAMPVDTNGNWLHDGGGYVRSENGRFVYGDPDWFIVQEPFEASLEIDGLNTGRSAKYATVRNIESGITYPMFVSDLLDVVRYGEVSDGRMRGRWTGTKRGQNYGIKIVKE